MTMRFRARDLDWHSHSRRSVADSTRGLMILAVDKWRWIAAMGAGLLLLVVVFALYSAWSGRRETDAAALLRKAVNQLETSMPGPDDAKHDEGMRLLHEVMTRYATSSAVMEATLRLGTLYYTTGKFEEARSVYITYLDKNPKGRIAFWASIGVGDTFLAQRHYDKAAETYSRLIEEFAGDPLLPVAQLHLARAFRGMKRLKDAHVLYEKIIATYPNTGWAQNAQAELIRRAIGSE